MSVLLVTIMIFSSVYSGIETEKKFNPTQNLQQLVEKEFEFYEQQKNKQIIENFKNHGIRFVPQKYTTPDHIKYQQSKNFLKKINLLLECNPEKKNKNFKVKESEIDHVLQEFNYQEENKYYSYKKLLIEAFIPAKKEEETLSVIDDTLFITIANQLECDIQSARNRVWWQSLGCNFLSVTMCPFFYSWIVLANTFGCNPPLANCCPYNLDGQERLS